jgi:hypothetical protein
VSVALVIQHAKRMRRIILSVAHLAVPYVSKLFHNLHDFRDKVNEGETRVLNFEMWI